PAVACSFSEEVCVHAPSGVRLGAIVETLGDVERAYRAYRALGLPLPLRPYDVYLDPTRQTPLTLADLLPTSDGWDRASAFTLLPPPDGRDGCAPAFAVAQGVGHA